MFKSGEALKRTPKSGETRLRILDAAIAQFREDGFEDATIRDIAARAEVATGAAYYYYPSKEAIVMDFYRRACDEMQPLINGALVNCTTLADRLRELIRVKMVYFSSNRVVLRSLLRNGADPSHPLSPFSSETKEIRDTDLAWFSSILVDCGIRIPRDLQAQLPRVLWFFQMGILFFWVIDQSQGQSRTMQLLDLASKAVSTLVRLSALPLMRPLRKTALQIVEIATAS